MLKEDVAKAKKIALVLTLVFGALISYAKFAGLFPPPNFKEEAKYGPPGWFSRFDLGPSPSHQPADFRPADPRRNTSV